MVRIDRFEDIDAWKKARELTKAIYVITSEHDFSREFGLKDQIRRAGVSVMSNIAEGFERTGDAEFRRFLSIAKGSAGEIKAQLYVALDAGIISQKQFDELYGLASETGKLIGGFIRYLTASSETKRDTR